MKLTDHVVETLKKIAASGGRVSDTQGRIRQWDRNKVRRSTLNALADFKLVEFQDVHVRPYTVRYRKTYGSGTRTIDKVQHVFVTARGAKALYAAELGKIAKVCGMKKRRKS